MKYLMFIALAVPGTLFPFTALPQARLMSISVAGPAVPEHGSISRQQALRWEDGFVSGNGRMGAMMFGAPDNEIFVANQGQPFLLYKNYPQQRNHWLGLRLIGNGRSNRDAIGARVTLTAGGRSWVKWVDPGNGFASQPDRRLIFGLGELKQIDTLEIRWPDGRVEQMKELPLDQYHTLKEREVTL